MSAQGLRFGTLRALNRRVVKHRPCGDAQAPLLSHFPSAHITFSAYLPKQFMVNHLLLTINCKE